MSESTTMNLTTAADADISELIHSVLTDARENGGHGDLTGGPTDLDRDLWATLTETGLAALTAEESLGGSEATWFEAAVLASATAATAARVPVVEHDLLALWLLARAGLPAEDGIRTVAILDADGRADGVAWAGQTDRIVVAWPSGDAYAVADLTGDQVRVTPQTVPGNRPTGRVEVELADLDGAPVATTVIDRFRQRAALARALQICGTLEQVLQVTITHVTERVQFGRPLAKFQAVQNLVTDIATETALARSATDAALLSAVNSDWESPDLGFAIAAARSCCGHAATVAVRNAHQALGAIGTTKEHQLHEFTQPALAWRSEYGTTVEFDKRLTTYAVAAGATGIWDLLTR